MHDWLNTYQFDKLHLIVAVLILTFLGIAGINLLQRRLCTDVAIEGTEFADSSIIYLLLSEQIGQAIFRIDKDELRSVLLASDPWIRDVEITRYITGTLKAEITETEALVRLVKKDGLADEFVDRRGLILPARYPASFDLPLLHAATKEALVNPQDSSNLETRRIVESKTLSNFVLALENVSQSTNALVSEAELDTSENVVLHATPSFGSSSIKVFAGKDQFEAKLRSLRVFWDKEPGRLSDIEYIDLRFQNQIVAKFKEGSLPKLVEADTTYEASGVARNAASTKDKGLRSAENPLRTSIASQASVTEVSGSERNAHQAKQTFEQPRLDSSPSDERDQTTNS